MTIIKAEVEITGSRPLLFNNFTVDSIPLVKEEKVGVAGNNPEEWRKSFLINSDRQLYLTSEYIFACLRAGAKHSQRGRGTMEPLVSATLQVLEDKILLNRFLPTEEKITRNTFEDVYIDVRPVSRRGVNKDIRKYHLCHIFEPLRTSFRAT